MVPQCGYQQEMQRARKTSCRIHRAKQAPWTIASVTFTIWAFEGLKHGEGVGPAVIVAAIVTVLTWLLAYALCWVYASVQTKRLMNSDARRLSAVSGS